MFGYNKWESVSALLLSLADVIAKRFISYVQRCLTSDCDIVNYVVQYGIWFGRMASPVGCSMQHCCNKYGFTADDIACVN